MQQINQLGTSQRPETATVKTIRGFRLSPLQERLWRLRENISAGRSQCAIEMTGDLKTEVLREALHRIAAQHEILRTVFPAPRGTPLQVIKDTPQLSFRESDLSSRCCRGASDVVQELLAGERGLPIDLEQGPTMQCSLSRLSSSCHVLLITVPALCADARSLGNLLAEVARSYRACLRGEERPSEVVQYADFSQWQNDLPGSQEGDKGAEFWHRQDLRSLSSLTLPFENESNGFSGFEARAVTLRADPEWRHPLKGEDGAGEERFLLASWATLLQRLSQQSEIVVSTLFDGRRIALLGDALGLFASYLPVRCRFAHRYRYAEARREIAERMTAMRSWQEYFPWRDENLTAGNILYLSQPPIAFEVIRFPADELAGGVRFSLVAQHHHPEPFRLKLSAVRYTDSVAMNLEYDPIRYSRSSVQRLARRLETLLAELAKNPQIPVSEVEVSSPEQRHLLLVEANDTETELAADRFFHHFFAAQVEKTPERVAVVSAEGVLSYRELDRRTNQLARRLERLGVGPESRVGLFLERSAAQLVGLVGILKAGGAYVPLDPLQPRERLHLMLEDLALTAVLTEKRLQGHLEGQGARVLCLDSDWEQIAREDGETGRSPRLQPHNLAYVIFTSGSTGRPKGVMIGHRSLVNLALALRQRVYRDRTGPLRVSLNAPLSFDASVKQVVQLLAGHTLYVVPESARSDAEALLAFLDRHTPDVLDGTPSQLSLLPLAYWRENLLRRLPWSAARNRTGRAGSTWPAPRARSLTTSMARRNVRSMPPVASSGAHRSDRLWAGRSTTSGSACSTGSCGRRLSK